MSPTTRAGPTRRAAESERPVVAEGPRAPASPSPSESGREPAPAPSWGEGPARPIWARRAAPSARPWAHRQPGEPEEQGGALAPGRPRTVEEQAVWARLWGPAELEARAAPPGEVERAHRDPQGARDC